MSDDNVQVSGGGGGGSGVDPTGSSRRFAPQDDGEIVGQGEGFGGKIPDLPQDPGSLASGQGKEQEPAGTGETVRMVEVSETHEMEPEVEGWIEKLERADDVHLQKPLVHDDQVIMTDPADMADDDMIVLPLTHDEVEKGLHAKVYDGARWLAEWCVRIIKLFGNKVKYAD